MFRLWSIAIAFAFTPTGALAFCMEPSAPYCATSYGPFDDGYDFERCKNEMEYYSSEVERYIQCVADEAEGEQRQALDEYNSSVEGFNRRARSY